MLRPATLLIVFLSVHIVSCAVNPVTGRRQLMFISEGQEIAMGQQYDPEIVGSMGLYGGTEWQDYLQRLGVAMAARTERPNLPWTFRVIDDPMVNAFAVPGGYVYITRGILAHFNSEAQLAAVLGHEITHVTARHSASQLSTQTLLQGAVGIGSILAPDFETAFAIAGAGVQVLSLKFSRSDESEADSVGLGYMYRSGYDPRPMPGVYTMLQRVSQMYSGGGGGTPEWLSSHPDPGNRRERMIRIIAALPDQSFSGRTVNAEPFLLRLHGMVFGEDPRQGFFQGMVFKHPDLAFEFAFPDGWRVQNQRSAVIGINAAQNALMQLSLADQPTASEASRTFFAQNGVTGTATGYRSNGLSGMRGDFTVVADGTPLSGHAAWVEYTGQVYQLVGYGNAQGWATDGGPVQSAMMSFRRLTDQAALNIKPHTLSVVRTDRAMTIRTFESRYPSTISLDELALINQVELNETIPSGTLVKRVVQ